ncbi:uncharacterized protein PAE49_022410 [Odontesthes bonariensis]
MTKEERWQTFCFLNSTTTDGKWLLQKRSLKAQTQWNLIPFRIMMKLCQQGQTERNHTSVTSVGRLLLREKQSGSDVASSEPCGHRPSGEQDCCQQGGSSFTTAADLRRQQTIQRRQKSFSCGHCEKSFPSAGQRTLHERVHTEEQLGRDTSRSAAHKPSHPEYELFHCYRCAAVFVSASALSKHQQDHQKQE